MVKKNTKKNTLHVPIKRWNDGMSRKLLERTLSHSRGLVRKRTGRTPLIMSPKLRGNLDHLGPASVGIGYHKLPGLDGLMVPSVTRTIRSMNEEMIPTREVMERKRSGRNVVGRIIKKERSLKKVEEREGKSDAMLSLKSTTSAMLRALSSITTIRPVRLSQTVQPEVLTEEVDDGASAGPVGFDEHVRVRQERRVVRHDSREHLGRV